MATLLDGEVLSVFRPNQGAGNAGAKLYRTRHHRDQRLQAVRRCAAHARSGGAGITIESIAFCSARRVKRKPGVPILGQQLGHLRQRSLHGGFERVRRVDHKHPAGR